MRRSSNGNSTGNPWEETEGDGSAPVEGVRGEQLPPERYDLRILSSLRRIIRSVDSHSRRLAREHGLTVPQLLCLLKLDELGPLTLKELSAEVFLNPSTIVGIVDRLENAGTLKRERSDKDRRQVRISLTARGREVLADSPSPLQDNLVQAISKLPETERVAIAVALEKIIACIEAPEETDFSELAPITAPVLEAAQDLGAVIDSPSKRNP